MPDTEAEAVAALVRDTEGRTVTLAGDLPEVTRLRGAESLTLVDLEQFEETPRRSSGTIDVYDAGSFVEAIAQRELPYPVEAEDRPDTTAVVYADPDSLALVGVLNDDIRTGPGWRDYRVRLVLKHTPEWDHWARSSGNMMSQVEFATLIEHGLDEILSPPAATMLALAQTFEATLSGRFKQKSRLGTGARTLAYEEDVQAEAASIDGEQVTLPEEIALAVKPFYGALVRAAGKDGGYTEGRYPVRSLIKFSVGQGGLRIGHKMVRPDEVLRSAFDVFVEKVAADLAVTPIIGPAPSPRSPGAWAKERT